MQLPIDYRNRPFKPKYLDEETPMFARWFTFGTFEDGTTTITDGTVDIMDRVPTEQADKIVKERNDWVEKLVNSINQP